ncbi:hypothetical protein U1Q18_027573 [Sarracenia purpurea var. burkii]
MAKRRSRDRKARAEREARECWRKGLSVKSTQSKAKTRNKNLKVKGERETKENWSKMPTTRRSELGKLFQVVDVAIKNFSIGHVDYIVSEKSEGCRWRLTDFYGNPQVSERKKS